VGDHALKNRRKLVPMLKRILVLLGETPSSVCARRFAFRLAKSTGARLAGLGGIDLVFIKSSMPGGIGATAFKGRLETQLKKQAEEVLKRLHDAFEMECRDGSISFELLGFEGDPIDTLHLAAETQDLMIAGHDTAFSGNVREQLSEVVVKLLVSSPRPLIICSDELSDAGEILIGYDGSPPAMRAIQLFVLLGIGQGKRIYVSSVDVSQEMAARKCSGAASYLRVHGYEVEMNPIVTGVDPADVLRVEVIDRKINTLVMGAYGHRGIRQFGSTTSSLISNPPCALFVYH
jgi:nucleotide-binding universal stress UspA family protein